MKIRGKNILAIALIGVVLFVTFSILFKTNALTDENLVYSGEQAGITSNSCKVAIAQKDHNYIWVKDTHRNWSQNIFVGAKGFKNASIVHENLSQLNINVRWMIECNIFGDLSKTDNIRLQILLANSDLEYTWVLMSGNPESTKFYNNSEQLTSGPVFNQIVNGDYINEIRVYFDDADYGKLHPDIYLNVDVIEINYFFA